MFSDVAKWSNICLTSKSQMLDQQCLIVWPGPNSLNKLRCLNETYPVVSVDLRRECSEMQKPMKFFTRVIITQIFECCTVALWMH